MNFKDESREEKNSSWLGWLMGIAVLLAAVLVFVSLLRTRQEGPLPPVGPRHPAVIAKAKVGNLVFQPLIDAGEKPITSEDFQGKVTLINFWGYWCPPCRMEFPHMVELRKEFSKNEGFQFVSVAAMNQPGDLELFKLDSKAYLDSEGYQLPVHFDTDYHSLQQIVQQTQLAPDGFAFPSTLVLDRSGNLKGFWIGYVPGWEKEMAQVVKDTLAAKN